MDKSRANLRDAHRPGIGLRAPHASEIETTCPALGFLEIHAENFLSAGAHVDQLMRLRRNYAISLHGVGLSLGSADGIDRDHLDRLKTLAARVEPMLISEHLSWSIVDGIYLNDLLPLPYTEEALAIVAANIQMAQDALGRPLLIENPSRYLRFRHSPITEPEFLTQLVRQTGCRLLCDVNNIYVSGINCGEDPLDYLDALPVSAVAEFHLAGHAAVARDGVTMLIDDHGAPVCDDVWALYRRAWDRFGPTPTLVEWDKNLPALPVLLDQAERAAAAVSEIADAVPA
jgi:uncharacterized protein (UPF0276 family)